MIIHFLGKDSMFTACGVSVAGRDPIPTTNIPRDVTCNLCKN